MAVNTGEQLWAVEPSEADPEIRRVSDIADAGPSGVWVLGVNPVVSATLLRYGIDGNLEGMSPLASEAGEHVRVFAMESTPGGVWLAGSLEEDAWVGLYDPEDGTVRDLLLEDHLGYRDEIYAIARGDDEVAVAATVSTSPNHDLDVMLLASTDILVVHFDLQGNELRRTFVGPSPDPGYVRNATQIVVDGVGNWFVGGGAIPRDVTAFYAGWLAPVQASSPWNWNTDTAQRETVGAFLSIAFGRSLACSVNKNIIVTLQSINCFCDQQRFSATLLHASHQTSSRQRSTRTARESGVWSHTCLQNAMVGQVP